MLMILVLVSLAVTVIAPATTAAASTRTTNVSTERSNSDSGTDLLLPEPVGDLPVVDDARWSSRWTDDSLIALAVWIILLLVLWMAGRPLARMLFPSFPDGGAGFARLCVVLAAGWLVWFAASNEVIQFRAVWAGYAVLFVGVTGALAAARLERRRPFAESTRAVVGAELAFWLVFAVFLLFRFIDPDSWHPLWGGEKPMEFAHVNALLRTPWFPPFDPWFSDGILNYYYYGEYLVAYLIKLTGIPSEIAFNLAQPTVMGLVASGIFSVSAALSRRLSRDPVDPLIAGGIGVIVLVALGNLVAAWDVLRGLPRRPEFSFDTTWASSRAIDGGITEFPYFTGLYADLHAHVIALPITILVIALGASLIDSHQSGWTVLPPFFGLALALGTLSASNAWDVPGYAVLALAAVFIWSARFGNVIIRFAVTLLVGAAGGALAYAMFRPFHDHYVALFDELGRVTTSTDLGQFSLHFGGLLAILGIAMAGSGLLSWTAVEPRWRNVTVVAMAVAIVLALAWEIVRSELPTLPSGTEETVVLALVAAGAIAMVSLRARTDPYLASVTVVAAVIGTAYLVSIGWAVLAIGLILAVSGTLVYFSFAEPAASYFGAMIAAAGSIIAGVELVFVVDDLASLPDWYRMNTIFKLYFQVWTLLAVAASAALAVLMQRRSRAVTNWEYRDGRFEAHTAFVEGSKSPVVRFAILACAVLIGASLVYPAVATAPRLDQRFEGHPGPSTLNALDWMRYGTLTTPTGQEIQFDDDLAAIRWFQEHVEGTPVIAEASIGPYRGNGSRFSIALGLPSVLGWDRHERQQRYYPEIARRIDDLRELYTTADPARKLAIIDTYRVEYIIVGDVERFSVSPDDPTTPYASTEGLEAFSSLVGTALEIAFESGDTIVYRVLPSDQPD